MGIAHVDFSSKESSLAESAGQEPIHLSGRDLRVDFSAGNWAQPVTDPSDKLYFTGCSGDEINVQSIFKQFSESIIDAHLCMLFILSYSVPTTHGITLNSEKSLDRRSHPSCFHLFQGLGDRYRSIGDPSRRRDSNGEPLTPSYDRLRRFTPGYTNQNSRQGTSGSYRGGCL